MSNRALMVRLVHSLERTDVNFRVGNNKSKCGRVVSVGKNYISVARMNIEIKGSHAHDAATSGVSGHLPISDDRLHNIFVNAFPRSTNSIIAARHNCRERVRLHYGEACSWKGEVRDFLLQKISIRRYYRKYLTEKEEKKISNRKCAFTYWK